MFVTSTHNPVLFFSTAGEIYRLQVWKCPKAARQRGGGRSSTCCRRSMTVKPASSRRRCGRPKVFKVRSASSYRRQDGSQPGGMDAFANIPSNGKFAMRFDDGSDDKLIGVIPTDSGVAIAVASRQGQGHPLCADDVRRFAAAPPPVRGMTLKGDDAVVIAFILHRVGTDPEEREDYLRFAPWKAEKRANRNHFLPGQFRPGGGARAIHPHRFAPMAMADVLSL
ncbi:MAG: hypothetical protein R3D83_09245 [Caenibius sp.]